MIYFLIFVIIFNILNNFLHRAIRDRKSKIWHTLSAISDIFAFVAIGFFVYFDVLILIHWSSIFMLLWIELTVRWISRDIMLGVGITAWMDINIPRGFYRISAQLFCVFFSFVFSHHLFLINKFY